MENAADALHMAFAVFVFVIAIGLAFTTFSQAREVADLVLYMNDKTNFDEYVTTTKVKREVGLETIIPVISSYITENDGYYIQIIDDSENLDLTFDIKGGQLNQIDPSYRDERINEPRKIKKYMLKALKKILETYENEKPIFEETYIEEEPYSGGRYILPDGDTIEQVNTETKIKIIYKYLRDST